MFAALRGTVIRGNVVFSRIKFSKCGRSEDIFSRAMAIAAQKPLSLYVCGKGEKGQLGLGASVTKTMIPNLVKTEEGVVHVSCGRNFTVFVTESGKVFTMGDNDQGCVLGNSTVQSAFDPVGVEGLEGVKIVQVAAGHKHSLALADDGSVYSWGCSKSLATSAFGGSLSSVPVLGHGNKESKATPTKIEGLSGVKVKQISCGGQHSAVLAEDGSVYTWGVGEQVMASLPAPNV
jgi:alpha-tubulin suppressor-like RCC1 family protein